MRGPYVSEDMGELWLPVEDRTYIEARREAAGWAAEFIGGFGRSRYLGRGVFRLCEHGADETCVPGSTECGDEEAWWFRLYEGTWRT